MKRQPSRVAPLIALMAVIALPLSLSCKCRPADSVYVVGDMKGQATLWQDGAARQLGGPGAATNAVQVSGGDVYVGGHASGPGGSVATVWKNGNVLWRVPDDNCVKALYLLGSDVYAAGCEYNATEAVVVRKNGELLERLDVGPSATINAFVLAGQIQ